MTVGDASGRARALAVRFAHVVGAVAICAIVVAAVLSGALRPLNDALANARFAVQPREPSHSLVIVELDVKSLRAAGRWPWSRARFAQAIDNLQRAGAKTIGFDVDFSARSSPEADAAFAAAVNRVPGSVVLPTFVQDARAGQRGSSVLVETSPLGALSTDAVLASVNVPVDDDGRVRSYAFGFQRGESFRPSIASQLAGAPYGRTGGFLIDYSVDPARLEHLSFEDVYTGRFDAAAVRGRNVLIGATALELGDEFATRKSGTLPGVYVHGLAYESLVAGRALGQVPKPLVIALACALVWMLRPRRRGHSLRRSIRTHLLTAGGVVLASFALQAATPVSIDVAALLLGQGLCFIWATRVELARRAEAIVQERERSLLHLALHEPETSLPNRRALLNDIGQALDALSGGALAVIAVGIDRHAAMRGAIGYGLFNEVIREVAERLGEAAGGARVAHLSTSVLGLVISAPTAREVRAKVRRVRAFSPSVVIGGHPVDTFVRLGVAYHSPGLAGETLLEEASVALDSARARDQRQVVFSPGAFVDPTSNLALMTDMRQGLLAGELSLHYQPKMTASSGHVASAEALVRWTHPVRGRIAPDAFIGVAEETGMIRSLTEWGLETAVADLARLQAAGHDLCLAVNISGALLADRGFKKQVLRTVRGVEHRLCLEITESAVIQHPEEAMAAVAEFRAAGLKVSIDDYGTGLSSLSYLKMLEADELKIDKSLVVAVADSARDRLILKSTVDLAHSLGMTVVAEGVETAEVLAALTALRCDTIQGYLISRPLPLVDLVEFLANHRVREMPAA